MKKTDVFLATSSKGKIQQIKEAAHEYFIAHKHRKEIPIRFHYITEKRDLHVVEDEDTLVGNCYKKVIAYGDKYKMWTIGDDSGFFVSALKMVPGVHSHRDGWTPKKVMRVLRGQYINRHAFIQTCAMLYHPSINGKGETRFTKTCTLEGTVTEVMPRSFGYGYDGIFVPNTIAPHTVQQLLNRREKSAHGIERLLMQYPRTMAMFAIFATLDMLLSD